MNRKISKIQRKCEFSGHEGLKQNKDDESAWNLVGSLAVCDRCGIYVAPTTILYTKCPSCNKPRNTNICLNCGLTPKPLPFDTTCRNPFR